MNQNSTSETSNDGPRSTAFVHALAAALLLAVMVGPAPANIDPAEDISAVIPLKPSAPMGQFPNHGDDERLSPNYTFTVDVQVTDQEQIGNVMWERVGSPRLQRRKHPASDLSRPARLFPDPSRDPSRGPGGISD